MRSEERPAPVAGRVQTQPDGSPGVASFRPWQLAPPSSAYIARDDRLYIRARSAVAGVIVTVRLRFQHTGGNVVTEQTTLRPAPDRSEAFASVDLAEGFLLGAVVLSTGTVTRQGQCQVELGVLRNGATAAEITSVLVSGYARGDDALSWPAEVSRTSLDGPGMLLSLQGGAVAPGFEIGETVPAGARWRLRAARFTFVTDATVANRRTHLVIDDGANILFNLGAADQQAASLTRNYNAVADGFARAVADSEIYLPLPVDVMMFQGWRIKTLTNLIQAGDTYSGTRLTVEEYIEG